VATQYYKKRLAVCSNTRAKTPDYPDGWYLLGNAFYADGQRDKAIEAYKRNLQLSPNFAKGRVNLGYMYFLGNKSVRRARAI
jgi:tetratricopeptide (TPR) repeat protein